MITFDDFSEEELRKFSIIKGEKEEPCIFCKTPTKYIEWCAEAAVCSPKCYKKLSDFMREIRAEQLQTCQTSNNQTEYES